MKKLIAMVLAAAACLTLAACGSKDTGKQPATADVVKAVADQLTFKDELMVLEDSQVPVLYRYDEAKVAEKTVYTSSSRSTAEEVTVFKVKDPADIEAVKSAMNERIEDQKLAYESYQPAEMPKINGAVIYTHGNYLILVMADDTSSVEKTFNAQF